MVAYQGINTDGVAATYDWITLSTPHLFLAGQIDLLGASCKTLYFKNEGSVDAIVRIIAARNAVDLRS
jgi:hypothetical protein